MKLTPKQERFVLEYLKDLNATQAAIRAGYSVKSAARIAVDLINKTHVADAIQSGKAAQSKRLQIEADEILGLALKRARTGFSRFVTIDADGQPRIDLSRCTPSDLDCLTEIQTETVLEAFGEGEVQKVRKTKIKLASQDKNIELLMKHLGLLTEKVDVTSGGRALTGLVLEELDDEELDRRLAAAERRKAAPDLSV
jgi:phage terminase small subunit